MKKRIILVIQLFMSLFILFAEKGICLDDNVRIRSNPSVTDSTVTGKLNKNDVFEIYGYAGTGEFKNGNLDFWACISSEKNKWVNAYWISSLPLNYSLLDYDDFLCTFVIKDFNKASRRFKVEEVSNESVLELDGKDLPYTLEEGRVSLLLNCVDKWPLIKKNCPKPDTEEDYKQSDVSVGSNSWLKYVQMGQYVNIFGFEINDDSLELLYGIHVGMNKSELESIFGSLKKDESERSYYSLETRGRYEYLYFEFENDKVKKITYRLDI